MTERKFFDLLTPKAENSGGRVGKVKSGGNIFYTGLVYAIGVLRSEQRCLAMADRRDNLIQAISFDEDPAHVGVLVEVLHRTMAADDRVSFNAGDSMLITADVPTVSQITTASRVAPYLSFALYLDPPLIPDLSKLRKLGSTVKGE